MFAKHVREFIRAKPDVIHYVDSPQISQRDQAADSGQYKHLRQICAPRQCVNNTNI